MPTYVCLVNYTDEGIKNIKDTVERTDRGAEIAQKHGVKLEQAYWTVGPYDMVVVFEAPDDEAISAHLLQRRSELLTRGDRRSMKFLLRTPPSEDSPSYRTGVSFRRLCVR